MRFSNCPLYVPALGLAIAALSLTTPVLAHQLNGLNSSQPTHTHVYKRNGFGNNLTSGHYARPPGSHGIVIWSASPERPFARPLPGFHIPQGHAPQESQLQRYHQPPAFIKQQSAPPDFSIK